MAETEGFVTDGDQRVTVVLATTLTPELLQEGYMRELVHQIQTMRKEAGFEVMDKIRITYQGGETMDSVVGAFKDSICTDTLAEDIAKTEAKGYTKECRINGEAVTLGVEKL